MSARSPLTGRFVERTDLDMPEIRRLYEAGEVSIRAIGRRFGTSDTLIRSWAERESWSRPPHLPEPPALAPARRKVGADPVRDGLGREIAGTLALLKALRAGLRRIVAGKAEPGDAQLLPRSGSVIDAFGVLAAAQARLILLHHKATEKDAGQPDPEALTRRLEEVRYAMKQVSGGAWADEFHRRLDEAYYSQLDAEVAKALPARIAEGERSKPARPETS